MPPYSYQSLLSAKCCHRTTIDQTIPDGRCNSSARIHSPNSLAVVNDCGPLAIIVHMLCIHNKSQPTLTAEHNKTYTFAETDALALSHQHHHRVVCCFRFALLLCFMHCICVWRTDDGLVDRRHTDTQTARLLCAVCKLPIRLIQWEFAQEMTFERVLHICLVYTPHKGPFRAIYVTQH